MYKKGDKSIDILSLANALVPEACMIIADQKAEKFNHIKRIPDISDKDLTYYKIAAAQQYLPAIGKIVDIIF